MEANNKIFLIRNRHGILMGKITLTEESTKEYIEGNHNAQMDIRLGLSVECTERFKEDCFVSEIIG